MINVEGFENQLNKLKEEPTIDNLLNKLRSLGPTAIFGGALRDWTLGKPPRDIDIVLDCPSKELEFLNSFKAEKNRFGGYYLKVGGTDFDIWNLESTWAIKNDSKFEKKLEVLPKTSFFNMDAITYRLDTKSFQDEGFTQAVTSRTLDIVYEPNPFPFLCVSKALIALSRYDFVPSANLKRYCDDQISRGYTRKSFDKYIEIRNMQADYDDCIKRLV
jgi:hypothetical protein